MKEGNRRENGRKPMVNRQVDDMHGERIGTGCDY
jgi:hypothetical protein